MQFLLDTNVVIQLLNKHAKVIHHVRAHSPQDLWLSAITMHELFFGAYKSQRRVRNLALIKGLKFGVLDFDRDDSEAAAEIRATLAAAGRPIGPIDTLIAGQARARDLTLVTNNMAEFARVPGLQLEDWQI